MTSRTGLVALFGLLTPLAYARCEIVREDFKNGGTYFHNSKSDALFTFVQQFQGCNNGSVTNTFREPGGTAISCSNTLLQPDNASQRSICQVQKSQLVSGNYSIIITSPNGSGPALMEIRTFSLVVAPQVTTTVTPTSTVTNSATAVVTSTATADTKYQRGNTTTITTTVLSTFTPTTTLTRTLYTRDDHFNAAFVPTTAMPKRTLSKRDPDESTTTVTHSKTVTTTTTVHPPVTTTYTESPTVNVRQTVTEYQNTFVTANTTQTCFVTTTKCGRPGEDDGWAGRIQQRQDPNEPGPNGGVQRRQDPNEPGPDGRTQ